MRVIGHRGAPALALENTLPSFEAALEAGADGVELDVRLTLDGRLVLSHDDDVERTAGRPGRISAMTFEEVRALDLGGGVGVPTFEEVLALVAGRTALVVEVKGWFEGDAYRPAAEVAEAVAPLLDGVEPLVVSSFDPPALARFRQLLPGVRTAIASYRAFEADWALGQAIEGGWDELHVPEEKIDAGFVERAHGAGREVLGWVVDDPERARALRDAGADGIFTDDPGAMRAALREDG